MTYANIMDRNQAAHTYVGPYLRSVLFDTQVQFVCRKELLVARDELKLDDT